MEIQPIISQLAQTQQKLANKLAVLDYIIKDYNEKISANNKTISSMTERAGKVTLASKALQTLLDSTSSQNLKRIQEIVNMALATVFTDQNVTFRIETSVKRNVPVYEMKLSQGGVEGSLNSFGGGVLSLVSVVLKIMLNIMAHKAPFIVLDETLSGLSAEYIPKASSLLKDICSQFGITLLLVTHQPLFLTYADSAYKVRAVSDHETEIYKLSPESV